MNAITWAELYAETCTNGGPTGRFVEVLEVAVTDFGGNEYGRATTARGVARVRNGLRVKTKLRALKTGGEVGGGDVYCGLCD
jgi:hypothetical protein